MGMATGKRRKKVFKKVFMVCKRGSGKEIFNDYFIDEFGGLYETTVAEYPGVFEIQLVEEDDLKVVML